MPQYTNTCPACVPADNTCRSVMLVVPRLLSATLHAGSCWPDSALTRWDQEHAWVVDRQRERRADCRVLPGMCWPQTSYLLVQARMDELSHNADTTVHTFRYSNCQECSV